MSLALYRIAFQEERERKPISRKYRMQSSDKTVLKNRTPPGSLMDSGGVLFSKLPRSGFTSMVLYGSTAGNAQMNPSFTLNAGSSRVANMNIRQISFCGLGQPVRNSHADCSGVSGGTDGIRCPTRGFGRESRQTIFQDRGYSRDWFRLSRKFRWCIAVCWF